MSAVLCLLGTALLVWPSTAATERLRALAGTETRPRRWSPAGRLPVLGAAPVLALLVGIGPAVAAGLVAATLAHRGAGRRRRTASARDDDDLRRALTVMSADMRAGAPMVHACRSAADELGPSGGIGAALRTMAAELELGGSLEADPDRHPGLQRLVRAWTISSQAGLPMVALLDELRTDLVARSDFRSRTQASLAGPRATAAVLAGLPVLGIGLGQLMGAAPLRVLLDSPVGSVLLVIGAGLVCAGLLWSEVITGSVLR